MEGIAAHSGKLASGAKVMAAAFEQAGATIASDLDELLMLGGIFATDKIPAGRRMHVVTNSGGEGSLIADIAHDVGLTLPPLSAETRTALEHRWPRFHARNPLDPWGTDDYEGIYPEVLRHAADEPGDIVVVAIDQQCTSGDHEKQLCLDLATYLAKATSGTTKVPVMLSPTSQDPDPRLAAYCRQAGIALLRGARPALAMLAELGRPREVLIGSATSSAENATLPGADLPLGEDEVLGILDQLGVSTPMRRRFSSGADAAAAYQSFDGPVVLKGVAPGLIHKTELGLVKTNLTSTDAVRQAAAEMEASASGLVRDLEFLLAEMVDGDLEIVVGYKRDPMFGPTVMVGSGGVWAEFFDDVSVHVGEIDNESARRLVARSRVGQMLAQARGGALHVAGVEAALCAVSALGAANPDVVGIDVNPLIVGRNHATAVDAVIERRPSREKEHTS